MEIKRCDKTMNLDSTFATLYAKLAILSKAIDHRDKNYQAFVSELQREIGRQELLSENLLYEGLELEQFYKKVHKTKENAPLIKYLITDVFHDFTKMKLHFEKKPKKPK